MNVTDFVGIAVVGAVISLFQEWLKTKFDVNSIMNRGITIALAVVIGIAYVLARNTVWWETIVGILAASSTVYGLFLKKSTSPQE